MAVKFLKHLAKWVRCCETVSKVMYELVQGTLTEGEGSVQLTSYLLV
jgi:hypothetical protein